MYYKSQLHELVQKNSWPSPHYEFAKVGSSHQPQFQVTVEVNGVKYESEPGYPNLKAAEHAAAKQALDALADCPGGVEKKQQQQSLYKSGLCKNVLQEYAQKAGYPLPQYRTIKSGEEHSPTFTTTVEIGRMFYCGGAAKCKKDAEVKAAKVAMISIQDLQIAPASAAAPPPPPVDPPPLPPPLPPSPPPLPAAYHRAAEGASTSAAAAAASAGGAPLHLAMQGSRKRSRAIDFIGHRARELGVRVKVEEDAPQHPQSLIRSPAPVRNWHQG